MLPFGRMSSLLLLSQGAGAIPGFLGDHGIARASAARIGYIADAARRGPAGTSMDWERQRLAEFGYDVADIKVAGTNAVEIAAALDTVKALYLAGGNTFVLMAALRSSGADRVIFRRVSEGLPYIGCSAGSLAAGPSIEPASLMDDPAEAPGLVDLRGLGLTDVVVIPHANASPPETAELIQRTLATYRQDHHLVPLRDDQALLVSGGDRRIVRSVD